MSELNSVNNDLATSASHVRSQKEAVQDKQNSELLYSQTGEGTGFQSQNSLNADQKQAAHQLRDSIIDALLDVADLNFGVGIGGRARSGYQTNADPTVNVSTRGRAGGKRGEMPRSQNNLAASKLETQATKAPAKKQKLVKSEATVRGALNPISSGTAEKSAFGKKAVLSLVHDLQEQIDLGIPKDKDTKIEFQPKTGKVILSAGEFFESSLTFGAKDGKLTVRIDNAKQREKMKEKAISELLLRQKITHTVTTKEGEKGRILTFNNSQKVASILVTNKGIVLSSK